MPDDHIDEQLIADALATRHTAAALDVREALARLATGLLRQYHGGGSDPVLDTLKKLLSVDEKAQCAQVTVDWYLEGRRDNPPFPQRPAVRGAMADLFTQEGTPATDTEVDALLNALVGAERDVVMAPGPAARMIIAAKLFDAYGVGGT